MSRRGQPVPEAAPLIGVVLAFGVAGFGFLFAPADARLPVAAVALLLLYGFTAYGVARSPDPAAAIPPDPTLAAGLLLGAVAAGYGVVVGQPMPGLLVAAVAAVPPAAYHARFGERVNPLSPDRTFLAAGGLAALVVALGVLVGDPAVGALDAAVLLLAAADYRDTRGEPLSEVAEFTLVAAALGGAALALLYFVLVADRPAIGLLAGAALVVVGAYFALGEERVRTS
ncbi:hypothetical protein [Halosegnis marinus]|uniref:Uncharacterized protein n=1 Tax=Halosegnis marinus TaxID=3034023 RepID=A0ABD5ZQ45_9EURY|nr:hypothetical protein [Halosegnis sp. DT85]